jgi:anti-sigma factor RsiW
MTNDPIYTHLRELSWQRKLTEAEEAELRTWLAAHPDAQADWEAEAGLNAALERLPDVPVPSNFTARVLQAVEREAAVQRRRSAWTWGGRPWLRWLPKAAFAAVILGAGLVSYHQFQAARFAAYARSVAAVSEVSSLPSPEILQDFDTIRVLNPTPPPDEQLLALLK